MSKLFTPPMSLPVGSFLFRNDLISKKELIQYWESKFKNSFVQFFEFCPMKEYYSTEMGDISKLSRFFIYSKELVARDELVQLKIWADNLEQNNLQNESGRIFNFDIGILSPENFILATGKPYSHRIYLSDGVYGELTYIFEKKTYKCLDWTYPDYAQVEIIEYFNKLRVNSQKFSDIS